MLPGEFYRKLRKLNPKLRVWCNDNSTYSAGLYYINHLNEYTEICGLDKNEVPEYMYVDEVGNIIKSGWRRILLILISKKLIDKKEAERIFNCNFDINGIISVQNKKSIKTDIITNLSNISRKYGGTGEVFCREETSNVR